MRHRRHPMGFLVGLAAFAVLALAAQPPAPAATATPAPLSGVVFLDQNGNGVRDAGEPGVGGARVSDQRHTVLTGADGRWTIAARGGYGLVNVGAPAGYRVGSGSTPAAPSTSPS